MPFITRVVGYEWTQNVLRLICNRLLLPKNKSEWRTYFQLTIRKPKQISTMSKIACPRHMEWFIGQRCWRLLDNIFNLLRLKITFVFCNACYFDCVFLKLKSSLFHKNFFLIFSLKSPSRIVTYEPLQMRRIYFIRLTYTEPLKTRRNIL